jgi:hypothetical protein
MDMVKENLYSKRKAADLVDLGDDSVLYNLYEAEMKSMDEPIETKSPGLFKRLRAEIPEGFEFRAALSAGAVTLYDALAMDKTKKNEVREGDGYERMLEKMMGSLKSVSDKEMGEKKKREKGELAQSHDGKKKMLARIYNFREAGVMKMKQKKEEVQRKLSAKEEKEQTARKMLKEGISEKTVLKFLLE